MRKLTAFTLALTMLFALALPCAADSGEDSTVPTTVTEAAITTTGKSSVLMEFSTGEVLYENNKDERLPPASVTKVMTMLL
ncbi:MAG: D-alanyl-D-alanine carboxypeptidase, partial [Eubacteriales bacterium]